MTNIELNNEERQGLIDYLVEIGRMQLRTHKKNCRNNTFPRDKVFEVDKHFFYHLINVIDPDQDFWDKEEWKQ
jgi:hypothetical protein